MLASPSILLQTHLSLFYLVFMVPDLVRPSVTEIQVRMDCNGCIQKIKKALHGINGIYDVYIDLPQQKLTIIGWADPERIVNAIRKSRKIATISSYTESTQPSTEQTEQVPQEGAPQPEDPNQPPLDVPPEEPSPPGQPPEEPPPSEFPPPPENPEPPGYIPPPENPQPQAIPIPTLAAAETNAGEPSQFFRSKDVGEVHSMSQPSPDYAYTHPYYGYRPHEGFQQQPPQAVYVNHGYNISRPSPHVTEYEYMHSPPRRMPYSTEEYHSNNGNGNITSMFSDENPNACTIM